jgi:imidazolonepropionase-like amidohydrolase
MLMPRHVTENASSHVRRAALVPADSVFALTELTIIDGSGAPPAQGQTIVVSNGVIAGIFADGRGRIPRDASVRSLKGKFAIPGLIDAHVHVATDPTGRDANAREQLRAALQGGVTAVRDMAGDAVALAALAKECQNPNDGCPRVHFAALFAGPSFFDDPRARLSSRGSAPGTLAWQRAVTPATDIPGVIADARATGASGIKLYADLTPELAQALTAEAKAQGLRVWSHAALYPGRASELARAGVHVVSHTMLLAWDVDTANMPKRYGDRTPRAPYETVPLDSPRLTALLLLMKERGTILDATLWVTQQIESAPPGAGGFGEPARAAAWAFAITRRAHALGVKVGAGTDGMMARSTDGLPNIHTEMELLVTRSGFTPLEAIHSATAINAEILGRTNERGTIALGQRADLVVLNANPVDDIKNTRAIVEVYKAGVRHRVER